MDRREKTYKQFNEVFADGRGKIAMAKTHAAQFDDRVDQIDAACEVYLENLRLTDYGRVLSADPVLEKVYMDLDFGLQKMLVEMRGDPNFSPDHPAVAWVEEMEAERHFMFLGGIGGIFSTFRDEPRIFDTEREREEREALRLAAAEFIERARSLLDHATVGLVYPKQVTGGILRASRSLEGLLPQLNRRSMSHAFGANPFQGGSTGIVRQFALAVCLLAFEVFGWITPRVLDLLLEMKSTTAAEFGLTPWIRTEGKSGATRKRDLRRYVEKSLDVALIASESGNWPTQDLIKFFNANRERLVYEDDGPTRVFLG